MENYTVIYLIWGTIRPQMFKETCQYWMDRAKYKDKIVNKVVVSTEEQKAQLEGYDVIVVKEHGYTYGTYQVTKNLEVEDTDIILLPTDDTYCPDNWDEYLYEKFKDWDGALFLDVGQITTNPNRKNDGSLDFPLQCLVVACMTFACLKKLNKCIFSPHYHHFFSDPEAYQNLFHMGLMKDDRLVDKMLFEHRHYYEGKRERDEFDDKNYGNQWHEDNNMFWSRMNMSLEERLATITAE